MKPSSSSNVLSTIAETTVQLRVTPGWKIRKETERVKSTFCWAVPSITVRMTLTGISELEDRSPHTDVELPSSIEYDNSWNDAVTSAKMM